MNRLMQKLIASLAIFACLSAPAFAQHGRGPCTPDEQARVIELAAIADKDPLGTMLSADGHWFEKWSDDVPDYMVGPDSGLLWFLAKAGKGELKRIGQFQHTLSTAAFQVKNHFNNPRNDPAQMEAKTLAGVEGLLRAYESMLAKNDSLRSAPLDEAIAARNSGGLAAFVKALPPMPER